MCIIRDIQYVAKYQDAKSSRNSATMSTHCEVDYVQQQKSDSDVEWGKIVRYFICDDTDQDSAHAFCQMEKTFDWLVKEKGADVILLLEDGATQQ